ncbi:MAG TPA: hypothetical protein VGP82_13570 [Ktedonobacterales bacterium]|jgi:hypothetical protein|nr:hypothetical protein [Ktedonobacterales bacterium]
MTSDGVGASGPPEGQPPESPPTGGFSPYPWDYPAAGGAVPYAYPYYSLLPSLRLLSFANDTDQWLGYRQPNLLYSWRRQLASSP